MIDPTERHQRAATALLALALLVAAGCRGTDSPGHDDDHDHDHAAHVVPAHRPPNFPRAIPALRAVHEQIAAGIAAGTLGPGDPVLGIAEDVANWLPEIAGESDMPEPLWDEVDLFAPPLASEYAAIRRALVLDSGRAEASAAVARAAEAIGRLESVLARCDAAWFDREPTVAAADAAP